MEIECACGNQYHVQKYETVNASNKILRNKIINDCFFDYKCPCCGKMNRKEYSFWYENDKNKFKVFCGDPGDMIIIPEKMEKGQIPTMEDYNYVGVTSLEEMTNVILPLENDMDYRMAFIIAVTDMPTFSSFLEDNDSHNTLVTGFNFKEIKENGFIYNVEMKEDGVKSFFTTPFSKLKYNKRISAWQDILSSFSYFYYPMSMAQRMRNLYSLKISSRSWKDDLLKISINDNFNKHLADLKNKCCICVITDDINDYKDVAVLSYGKELKYKIGDNVILNFKENQKNAKIIEMLRMNQYDCPWEFENLPYVE